MDQDDLSNKEINDIRTKAIENNIIFIISKPAIECVLYAIFDTPNASLNKKCIEQKFENKLSENGLKYNHKVENLEAIFNWLKNDKKRITNWEQNLKKLNDLEKSNFINVLNFLRGK